MQADWKAGCFASKSASPPRVPATGTPGAQQGASSGGHPRTSQISYCVPPQASLSPSSALVPARTVASGFASYEVTDQGTLPNVPELQLSHVSPTPRFCHENQAALCTCRSAAVLLALSSKSVTGGRGNEDAGREVKGAAQRRWRGILLPSAEPAGSETWVCLPPAQTMPALQEAARYARDICLVVKCLIF